MIIGNRSGSKDILQISKVWLSLGANLGRPRVQLRAALNALAPNVTIQRVSLVCQSTPVGGLAQADFYNLACSGLTTLRPLELLREVHRIEGDLGRVHTILNGPRTIDIDILAYGDVVLDAQNLILPHPRLHRRAFVLVPLAEIAPDWRHPIFHKTAAELLSAAGPLERIERVGSLPD